MEFPAWDPVLFDIPYLPIDVRWYGLMYVVGFVFAQWVFVRLARRGFLPVDPAAAPDLIFYCVIGVMLGGRTGYALFYDQSLLHPMQFLQVWKGGLAFHGGLGGVWIATWLFCRRHKIGWGRVADSAALAVPVGIFAVRMANFINGELFGRKTTPDTWGAMQFPTDVRALEQLRIPAGVTMRDRELCIQVACKKLSWEDVVDRLSTVDSRGREIDWERVQPFLDWDRVREMTRMVDGVEQHVVPYRHPSQLYEGIGEGLLVGLVLLILYLKTRNNPLRAGRYSAVFLLGYAAVRFSLEWVRKPDEQFFEGGGDGSVLFGMTMGQTLSVGMVIGALLLLCWPKGKSGSDSPDSDVSGSTGGEPS
ncbi:MAG: prolipoprotein diacylglyceryl transferase [Planctomycetota bacterium]